MIHRRYPAAIPRSLVVLFALTASSATAQQRPLETQDPETIGTGHVLVELGVSYARDEL